MAVPLCNVSDLTASTRQRLPKAEMSSRAVLVAAVSTLALLTGCATRSLSTNDRAQVCRIDVKVKCSQATFVPNPFSTGAGALVGAGGGAIAGLFSPFPRPLCCWLRSASSSEEATAPAARPRA